MAGDKRSTFNEYVAQSPFVSSALGYATIKHKDQKYGQEPYVNHLLAVAQAVYEHYLLSQPGQAAPLVFDSATTDSVVAAALLHDVMEDTDTKVEDLDANFNQQVANIVLACTKDPKDEELDLCRGCSFKRTVPYLKKEPHAIAVKVADRLVNMRKSTSERSTHLNMYVREHPGFKRLLTVGVDQPANERLWVELDKAYEAAQLKMK